LEISRESACCCSCMNPLACVSLHIYVEFYWTRFGFNAVRCCEGSLLLQFYPITMILQSAWSWSAL
jgi:hypothetical protein